MEVAKTCGATHTYLINKASSSQEIAADLRKIVGTPLDLTIECSGAASAISTAIYVIFPRLVVSFSSTYTLAALSFPPIGYKIRRISGISRFGCSSCYSSNS